MTERKKHAEALHLLMDAVTHNSEEELRAKNQIHEHQKQIDRLSDDYPSASAQARILMDQAREAMAERQAIMTELWDSIAVLVDDRKAAES